MNLCIFDGNFVRKPELRQVGPEKVSVCNFTIAVNRKFNLRNGEQKKEVTYIDCEAWDTGGETIARNCNKGDFIIIYTSAKNDFWEEEGKKRSRVKFRVDRFEFVPGTRRHTADEKQVAQTEDDNIPF